MIVTGDAKLIATAFVKALGEMTVTVTKDKKGNYGDYATLAALVAATASPLAKHGLAIIQEASIDESGVTVDTWLIHESGATIEFEALTLPLTDRRPQAVGSAITYGRRYQLASVCGLAPDDADDDGQAAQDATPAKSQYKAQVAPKVQHRGNVAQRVPVSPTNDVHYSMDKSPVQDSDKSESPPHQRLWGIGQSVVGKQDWDMARAWIIRQWSKTYTPDNVRSSAGDLSEDEKTLLGDYINQSASEIQKAWPKQKAYQLSKAQEQQQAAA